MSDQSMSDSAITERLTAYLDGELSDKDHQEVEQKLLHDNQYRSAMQRLQKTWDLLDFLPTSRVDHSFTQSTLEMVISETQDQLKKHSKRSPFSWPLRFGSLLGLFAVTFAASFLLTQWIKDAPNRELRSDIHIIENLNHLERAQSIEFIELLAKKNILNPDDISQLPEMDQLNQRWVDWGESSTAGEDKNSTEKYLQSTSADLMTRLQNNRKRYQELELEGRDRVKKFYAAIQNHPQRDLILKTIENYSRWFVSLSDFDRAELSRLKTIDEKVERIAAIKEADRIKRFGAKSLPNEDGVRVRDWVTLMLWRRQENIRWKYDRVKDQVSRPVSNEQDGDIKMLGEMLIAMSEVCDLDELSFIFAESELNMLKQGLSDQALEILEQQSPSDQDELVFRWIQAAIMADLEPKAKQIQKFFDTLSEQEKSELDTLPPVERRVRLQDRFRKHQNEKKRMSR